MQKLKVAANSGQNPGFDFLKECWDDPALQIVIRKLVAKFPQWGIACEVTVEVEPGRTSNEKWGVMVEFEEVYPDGFAQLVSSASEWVL
ncbi:hypothetical protein H6G97_40515 [Nostoc flagelliforme FACHB-838]|uniref:Uncharacterized protein n=1 Tax=Nostoc flagelliforme FACHB-838 TaxID=2692904 RepID=A0ABR8E2M2_9NOSO|nr:hypothetical protein [Nostoc flagelliforme]MBD2535346.1 hypothetical protein [Nostoc flagelliforme FACHB-838]